MPLLGVLALIDKYAEIELKIRKTERFPVGSRPIAKLLQDWGLGRQMQECLWVVAVDKVGYIRTVVEVGRGMEATQEINIPAVLTAVLTVGASTFMVAHNHPGLSVLPSAADDQMTRAMMRAANACGLSFEEHIIVGPTDEYFSFVEAGLLIPVERGTDRPRRKRAAQ